MRSDDTGSHLNSSRCAVLLLVLLAGQAALAHVFAFDLLLPRYVGNVPDDAGLFPLQWFDSETAGGMATAQVKVTRRAWGPFGLPDANDVLVVTQPMALASPVDFADWDSRDAGAGCWQPYADIDDPIEGRFVSRAEGRISVGGAPALWVTTPPTAQPDDAGRLLLTWDLDSAADTVTAIEWFTAGGAHGTLAARLPVSGGTRTASYGVDVRRLPAEPAWLHLELSSDAGGCDAWWKGYIGTVAPDGGEADAGADAGAVDAGADPGPHGGCGCSSSGPLLLGLSALALRHRDRRRRARA